MDVRENPSNEKRLIDANRALEIVRDQGIAHPNAYHLTNYATLILREAPTVDAVPVRHGRWIEKEKYTFGVMYDCSICNNRILDNWHSWNYCPNCGAKMDGGED